MSRLALQRHELQVHQARLPVLLPRRAINTVNSHETWKNDRGVIAMDSKYPQFDIEDSLRRKRRTDWKRQQQVSSNLCFICVL